MSELAGFGYSLYTAETNKLAIGPMTLKMAMSMCRFILYKVKLVKGSDKAHNQPENRAKVNKHSINKSRTADRQPGRP